MVHRYFLLILSHVSFLSSIILPGHRPGVLSRLVLIVSWKGTQKEKVDVESCLVYGSKTWAVGMEGEIRTDGSDDMRVLRWMYGISLNDKWWSVDLGNMVNFSG